MYVGLHVQHKADMFRHSVLRTLRLLHTLKTSSPVRARFRASFSSCRRKKKIRFTDFFFQIETEIMKIYKFLNKIERISLNIHYLHSAGM